MFESSYSSNRLITFLMYVYLCIIPGRSRERALQSLPSSFWSTLAKTDSCKKHIELLGGNFAVLIVRAFMKPSERRVPVVSSTHVSSTFYDSRFIDTDCFIDTTTLCCEVSSTHKLHAVGTFCCAFITGAHVKLSDPPSSRRFAATVSSSSLQKCGPTQPTRTCRFAAACKGGPAPVHVPVPLLTNKPAHP